MKKPKKSQNKYELSSWLIFSVLKKNPRESVVVVLPKQSQEGVVVVVESDSQGREKQRKRTMMTTMRKMISKRNPKEEITEAETKDPCKRACEASRAS